MVFDEFKCIEKTPRKVFVMFLFYIMHAYQLLGQVTGWEQPKSALRSRLEKRNSLLAIKNVFKKNMRGRFATF